MEYSEVAIGVYGFAGESTQVPIGLAVLDGQKRQ
jgi:hypothetical protein